jgi:L-ascorbate metabolism protein UlaG (beta-lactamase superfamily)
MRASPHWSEGRFTNEQPMWVNTPGGLLRSLNSAPAEVPDTPVPVVVDGVKRLRSPPASGLRVTWFGHSSVLVEIDGATVLIDPLWSERASPVSWVGPKRWYPAPVALRELPRIDVVLISHDHYDHLDRSTIAAMTNWDATFVVPLGVGAYLERWGIPAARIVELDWWQFARAGSLEIIATPARHASGRISLQGDGTLWAGYALLGAQHRVWYSGDTGFHSALEEIGRRFGPFDVTLIEAGQYDADWPDWHRPRASGGGTSASGWQTNDSSALGTAQTGPSRLDGAGRARTRGGKVQQRRSAGAAARRKSRAHQRIVWRSMVA